MFKEAKKKDFQILALHHAEAILLHDMPNAVLELEQVLLGMEIPISELVKGGGGEGEFTQRVRKQLSREFGWKKHKFEIKKIVDGIEKESISHEIDHVKNFGSGVFALEIEWNNKDPFFDRDLENFKRLHADGVISIGAIITRGESLQRAFKNRIEAFALQNDLSSIENLGGYYSPTERQQKLQPPKKQWVLLRRVGRMLLSQISSVRRQLIGESSKIGFIEVLETHAPFYLLGFPIQF